MKITFLLASFFLFAGGSTLLAQQPSPAGKEAPPDPPLLGSAPAESQWTITYTLKNPVKDADTPEAGNLRKMRLYYNPIILSKRVLKEPGQMVIYTTYEAGLKTEAWVISGLVYELPYREGQAIKFDESKTTDFSEINWVNADNFRGTVEFKGAKYHLYVVGDAKPSAEPSPSPVATPRQPGPPPGKVLPRRAYIDVTSRLPVIVDLGDTVLTYQYAGPAATFPTPDERIKKLMQEHASLKRK